MSTVETRLRRLSLSETQDNAANQSSANTLLVEVCWEVPRKVGGIYTVVKSKAPVTSAAYGDRYLVVAPYYTSDQLLEFEFKEPKDDWVKSALVAMETKYNCEVKFGRWLVRGYPNVILINVDKSMWRTEGVFNDLAPYLPRTDKEVNEAVVFGGLTAWLFCELHALGIGKEIGTGGRIDKIVGQFHEWMCGVPLILLRKWNVKVATVFTTHATILGRYLSASKLNFYHMLDKIDTDKEAGTRGVYARHWIEKGSALGAHVFTTVSEITALEATKILGRKPDVLVPNGLQVERFEALHEFQNLHAKYKAVISDFVRGHFYGHLDFDVDSTLYFFISGRYEVFNKGMDVYINALSRLNSQLKAEGSKITVVAFIITSNKDNINNFNVESLTGQTYIRELRRECDSVVESMSQRMFEALLQGKILTGNEILQKEDVVKLKSRIASAKRAPLPPMTTHNIIDDNKDEVMVLLKKHELYNRSEDRVKVIYHPEFLTRTSPLLPLDYEEFVRGCHLGVFPSYYEPWGYTPAECVVMGVPNVSSNLSGFGNFIHRRIEDPEKYGLYIMDRQFKSPEESMVQITQFLHKFCLLSRRQRIELRNRTESLSYMLDWSVLAVHYEEARKLALERV